MMQGEPRRGGGLTWIVGLAGLGLVLLCCVGGGAAYWTKRQRDYQAAAALEERAFSDRNREMEEARRRAALEEEAARAQAAASAHEVANGDPLATADGDPLAGTAQVVNVTMTVRTVSGVPGLDRGATCNFSVTHRVSADGLNCRASVTCGTGSALYGASATNGFFACPTFSTSPPAVVGADASMTETDGDPSLAIDTTAGTVTIADDAHGALGAFRVTGTATVSAAPAPSTSGRELGGS